MSKIRFSNKFQPMVRRVSMASCVIGLWMAASVGNAMAAGNAAPFGLEIGVTSCDSVRTKFANPSETAIQGGDTWLVAQNADELFPGAETVAARCSANRLIAVQIEASKGGMGNEQSRSVYKTLAGKYKRVAGGPMPSLGDGYARFVAGNTVIEQEARHLSFSFTLTYLEKSFYDAIVAQNAMQKRQTATKKESVL